MPPAETLQSQPRGLARLTLLVVVLLTSACASPTDTDPKSGSIGDVASVDAISDGAQSDASDDGTGDAGSADVPPTLCPEHVLQCKPGQGCHEGVCGKCDKPKECRAMEGCAKSTCGACTKDSQCKDSKVCIDGFCLRETVMKWDIQMADADWKKLLATPSQKKYYPCKLKVADTLYEPCQIRIRGGVTKYYPKVGLRIKFADGQDNPGYTRKINLRAEYNDPTYMRNFLASWLFDAVTDIPTPRVRYRRMSVNGKDIGLYAEVERVAQSFRRKRGRDPAAPLYEADPISSLEGKCAAALLKVPKDIYKQAYQKHSDPENDYSDLIALIEGAIWVDHNKGEADKVRTAVRMDWYIDYLATHAVMMGADHVRKNYYLSRQKSKAGKQLWEFYPWDMDMSFGCVWVGGKDKNICIKLDDSLELDIGVLPYGKLAKYGPDDQFFNLLIDTVLRAPDLREKFEKRVCHIITSPQWNTQMPLLINALQTHLLADVKTDATDLNKSEKDFNIHVNALREWIEKRTKHVKAKLDCGS
ncbi:MAG: CotH kinase family protein [Myxococcales bacterium]|nr:CotH kinase family protein [Myxococcales bacterium]